MSSRLFLFTDLDGTLEDSRADMTNAAHKARHALGLEARPSSAITPNVNRGMPELYKACFDDFLAAGGAIELVQKTYEEIYFRHVADATTLYDGVKEALFTLKERGVLFSLITNKPEHLSRELLRKLDILPVYDAIMGGDSCAESKPSALPLKIAAEKLGFNPSKDQAFMWGDTVADIRAGKSFGAKTIWCSWGYLESPEPETPDYRISKPADLCEIIRPS